MILCLTSQLLSSQSTAFIRTKIEGVRSGSSMDKVRVRPVMGLEGRNVQRMEARAA